MSNANTEFSEKYFGVPTKESELDSAHYLKVLPKYRRKYFVEFIQKIPHEGMLLDIGCGKGKAVRLVKAFRPDVKIIATDITDMSPFLPEGVIFKKVGVDELMDNFNSEQFDAIISEHVIEHMVYPNTFFAASYSLLKPEGRIFIETPNWTRLWMPFSPLYFWSDYTHIHPYCTAAFRRAFIEYGFNECYVKTISSIDFGRRFLLTRIEDGKLKTGLPQTAKVFVPKKSILQKIFNAVLDLTIHQIAFDILIGVAEKPKKN